jgi:hypothetical protein
LPTKFHEQFGFDREAFRQTPPSMTWDYGNPTYLYLMQCEHFFKVGIASDPYARQRGLQAPNPFPVRLLTKQLFETKIYAMLAEPTVHRVLEPWRHGNEWFNIDRRTVGQAISMVKTEMPFVIRKHNALRREIMAEHERRFDAPARRAKRIAAAAVAEEEWQAHKASVMSELFPNGPTKLTQA